MYNTNRIKITIFSILIFITGLAANDVFNAKDLLRIKSVAEVKISPDGKHIAYTIRVPREITDKPGGSFSELHVLSIKDGESRPFISGEENVSAINWKPDGSIISFRIRRGEGKTQVWGIPVSGGEAYQITHAKNNVMAYAWLPSGNKIAYTSKEPATKKEKTLKEKGFKFIFYHEDWKHVNLYLEDLDDVDADPLQLTENITVSGFVFSPDGSKIAMAVSEKNLIDYNYMFRAIHILDVATKKSSQLTNNAGKLGNFAFSPDGKNLAYTAAFERKDHAVSQAYVISVNGGKAKNLTPKNFKGHITWVNWKDKNAILYLSNEAMANTLSLVNKNGGERDVILNSYDNGVIFRSVDYTKDFKYFAFNGNTPYHSGEVFFWRPGKDARKMTEVNPWLKNKIFGLQTVVSYKAEDGWDIEGLLIKPVDYKEGEKYPLVVLVHGGPESNYSNGWLSRYATPGQVLAGKGYMVFYPNYRASTGYGLEFAAAGYEDAAGKEFDDIKDGILHLINIGLVDKERVGLGGGSYGGYASAWFATYYTKYVNAVCMFVGISDLISKRGTTDIPYEELYVHSGKKLEETWKFSLERSPIYYARQSKTATLIYGGAADTRVHPSQSLELYTRMHMNNHPAVRLVQYPGEGHGNRKYPGQIDVLYRILDWYDWYVKDNKPLGGPMPPLDISDKYGIELTD